MTNMRTFWWMALMMMMFWIYIQWQNFLTQKNTELQDSIQVQQTQDSSPQPDTQPNVGATPAVPSAGTVTNPQPATNDLNLPSVPNKNTTTDDSILITTDVFKIRLSKVGGDIRQVQLLKYPVSVENKDNPFVLLDEGKLYHIAQSGWVSEDKTKAPTHKHLYSSQFSTYTMGEDNSLLIPMVWEANGIKATKTFEFTKSSYLINVHYDIENLNDVAWFGSLYSQIIRNQFDNTGDSQFVYSYTGPAIYTKEDKYQKHDFDDLESSPLQTTSLAGWIGMLQHYFLTVAVPNQNDNNNYYSRVLDNGLYQVGTQTDLKTVAANSSQRFTTQFVIGPKIQYELEQIAEGLDLTVDYGFLTIIAQPIYWLLAKIQTFVGNWGFSIILLTMIIKLLFYKLSETSYRSMARMRELGPRLKQLKERYGDDKANFQKKMMAMYKEEKINPMGGCLPILVQMPVFIALYWVLLESVELRQAPFILWITDMSQKDPYFILPIIMGLSMFVQQRLNPAPLEDMQRRIMQIMPIAMTIFFMFFPSGLVLYWVSNNILSIVQQWYITRKIKLLNAEKKSSS